MLTTFTKDPKFLEYNMTISTVEIFYLKINTVTVNRIYNTRKSNYMASSMAGQKHLCIE